MARTAEGRRLTQVQRREQLRIRAAALRDVTRLWQVVNATDLTGTFDTFVEASLPVVAARRREAAESASVYFGRFRTAEGFDREPPPMLAPDVPDEAVADTLRGAGLGGIVNARRAGQSPQAAARNGLVKVHGSVTKLVLDGGRETVRLMLESVQR